MLEQSTRASSREATLHMWRTAAEVVATDTVKQRRQIYQQSIDLVRHDLRTSATVDDIITAFGRSELHATAIRAALCHHGKVLNAEVIVAAACWQHLCALLAQQDTVSSADVTETTIS